ncbi:PAS domain-containing sensor histidine kinase [Gemmatimonas phototrophica]|uniref:PAS domain-containing sensor histidine kinase n=1 Tax=Gemmatimonas phototrophica TaxID=1379270 RepID=UPI0009EDB66B|nr:PAS domain-containing sensor histidine kinase [Gemmatimonas phototrophica]
MTKTPQSSASTPPSGAAAPTEPPPLRADDLVVVQAFFRRILEAMPAQLAVFSPEGHYEYVTPSAIANPAVREWIVGKTDVEYAQSRGFPPEVASQRLQTIRQVAESGESLTFEETLRSHDGTSLHYRRMVSPVCDANGNVQHVLGYGLDITAQRKAEDELRHAQKMEAIGRLAGGVAHDFNNLITIIGGFADCLHDTFDATDERRHTVQAIRDAAERAAGLTRQLLSFSRRAPIELAPLDVHGVIGETVNMLQRLLSEQVHLSVDLRAAHPWIRADVGQLRQVLLNLAVNARDAMPHGGVLTIGTCNVEHAEGQRLELRVTDTGVGMSDEIQARIFEPFFTTKLPDQGTGLGLSTVYGIVKQGAGQILVESELGHGSTFQILWPVVDQPEPRVSQPAVVSRLSATHNTEVILVAEDETGVRQLVTRILKNAGYTVLEAMCGTDALAVVELHEGPIDLLLSDVVMADFGGRTLADAARVLRPDLRVLYMSGYADEDNLVEKAEPLDGFLDKPFSVSGLLTAVRTLLSVDPSPRVP